MPLHLSYSHSKLKNQKQKNHGFTPESKVTSPVLSSSLSLIIFRFWHSFIKQPNTCQPHQTLMTYHSLLISQTPKHGQISQTLNKNNKTDALIFFYFNLFPIFLFMFYPPFQNSLPVSPLSSLKVF